MIASGISNLFKRKKPEKTVDTPDAPTPATRPDKSSPAPKSRNASVDIPETSTKTDKPETGWC